MVHLLALLIFLGSAAATWAVGVSLYQSWLGGPGLLRHPLFWPSSALAVGLVTCASFVAFPWGYVLTVGVWWFAARNLLELPRPRAFALWLILSALSLLSRLVIRGLLAR
jgi:hypothetical protein